MMTSDAFGAAGEIAWHFNIDAVELHPISSGLINHTFRVVDRSGKSYLLQRLNTAVFKHPVEVQENFVAISNVIRESFTIPELILTSKGDLLFEDHSGCWRCFSFIENSYAPSSLENEEMAYTIAHCFGTYTNLLSKTPPRLHTILPGFHDLSWRYQQLTDSLQHCRKERLDRCKPMLTLSEQFSWLVDCYKKWESSPGKYPLRILHQDCKVSNILFETGTHQLIGPIDFDTTQPGLFFSDLGDMIRSIAPSHDENFVDHDQLFIRKNYLKAVMEGYLKATEGLWTMEERAALPLSGHVLLYMQAIRFLADYLNNDMYYQVQYPEQNFDRAMNQFRVLELLDECMPRVDNPW